MSQEVHNANEHPSDYYDRYSRQHYVLGEAAMNRMAKSNVFISGIGGLGIEIGTWLFFLRLFLCHMRFSSGLESFLRWTLACLICLARLSAVKCTSKLEKCEKRLN